MQRKLRFLWRTLPSLIKIKFAYTFSIETGGTKVPPVFRFRLILFNVKRCKCKTWKFLFFLLQKLRLFSYEKIIVRRKRKEYNKHQIVFIFIQKKEGHSYEWEKSCLFYQCES